MEPSHNRRSLAPPEGPTRRQPRLFWRGLVAITAYLLAALIVTYPLLFHLGDAIVSCWNLDAQHSLWINWWFKAAVDSPDLSLFRTNWISYPHYIDLQFADINLAINGLFYVLQRVIPLTLAYNLMTFGAFLLNATIMERLVVHLGCTRRSAWLAGLLFASSPYWLSTFTNAWVYLLHMWVLPLTLLAIQDAHRAGRIRFAVLGGLAGLTFHVSPHYFFFLGALLATLAPWHWRSVKLLLTWRGLGNLTIGLVVLIVLVLPRAIAMVEVQAQELVRHTDPMSSALAAPLAELFLPSSATVERRASRSGYMVVFVGYTLLGTITAGWLVSGRRRRYLPWLITGGVMFLLSLGPQLKLVDGQQPNDVLMPGYFVQRFLPFKLMSNHWRWSLPGMLCLIVAFSIAFDDLLNFGRRRYGVRPAWAFAMVLLLYALEVTLLFPVPRSKPIWSTRPSPIAEALRHVPGIGAIYDRSRRKKLNQIAHERPIAFAWLPAAPRDEVVKKLRLIRRFPAEEEIERQMDYVVRHGFNVLLLDPTHAAIARDNETRLLIALEEVFDRPRGFTIEMVEVRASP